MSKKKTLVGLILLVLAVVLNVVVLTFQVSTDDEWITFSVTVKSERELQCQVRYLQNGESLENGFSDLKLINQTYNQVGQKQTLSFSVPANICYLRFDPCDNGAQTEISEILWMYGSKEIDLHTGKFRDAVLINEKQCFSENSDVICVDQANVDPYIVWEIDYNLIDTILTQYNAFKNIIIKVLICIMMDVLFFSIWRRCETIWEIPKEILFNRKLILSLSKNDFKTKFAGSYFGIFWAFVQPVVTILVYWFVFDKALNAGTQSTRAGITVPFVLWLVAGLVPWFFFSEVLLSGTNVLIEYNYLVKKVVFKISTLPIVKIISSLFVHLFFIAFTIILFACYKYFPGLYALQMLYYSFCMIMLSLGLIYATSAIVIFFRDLTQVINIVLQVGMWVTPIMWNMDAMYGKVSPLLLGLLKLNPMYYVISGYRDSLINHIWFWDRPEITLYFWMVVVFVFCVGFGIFRRLQIHFADVL